MDKSDPLWLIVGILAAVAFVSFFVLRFVASRLLTYLKVALFSQTEIRIRSSLSLSDVEHRLHNAIPRWMLSTPFKKSVVGQSGDGRLNVSLYRPLLSSPFSPRFVGKVMAADGQTWIVGHFRLGRYVQWFMTFWFGLLGLIGGVSLPIGLLMATLGDESGLFFSLGPLVMLAFGIGFIKIGQWMSREDQNHIEARITEISGGVVA